MLSIMIVMTNPIYSMMKKNIRLPRKVKKRYKKMLADRLGIRPDKLKVIFPNRNFLIDVEYGED